jgi:hypothetical protein
MAQPKTYVKPEAAITVFELLLMGGLSPETCWAIKKQQNNKLYYTVASCWFFLRVLYYDARIHERQVTVLSSLLNISTTFQSNNNHFLTTIIPHLEQLFKLSERQVTCSALTSIFKSLNKKVKKLYTCVKV